MHITKGLLRRCLSVFCGGSPAFEVGKRGVGVSAVRQATYRPTSDLELGSEIENRFSHPSESLTIQGR